MIIESERAGEKIVFGTAQEITDLATQRKFIEFGIWTDQQGRFALCKVWPVPSWVEITRHDLYRAA